MHQNTRRANRHEASIHLTMLIGLMGHDEVAKSLGIKPVTLNTWTTEAIPGSRCVHVADLFREKFPDG